MQDPFKSRIPNLNGPATDILPVVPSNGTDLPIVALALYIETAGTVVFIAQNGETRTVKVADFAILPVGVRRVLSTGTTATGIHALILG